MSDQSDPDYRFSHQSSGYGKRYAQRYLRGYYAVQWQKLEKPLLAKVFAELGTNAKTCLDFACGTGRITAFESGHFAHVTGVDISSAMLADAPACPNVEYVCRDITKESLGRRFDVVTSFRFFLNAQADLRTAALKAIGAHLAPGGTLVLNVHMNAGSPTGLAIRLGRRLTGRRLHNVLSLQELTQELNDTGYVVERVTWYSFMPRPGRLIGDFVSPAMEAVEHLWRGLGVFKSAGQSFLVLAKRADP